MDVGPTTQAGFACALINSNLYLLTYMRVLGLGFVTGKLPQNFTKPDTRHLGLNLNVPWSFEAKSMC